jgi:hypothetical protein
MTRFPILYDNSPAIFKTAPTITLLLTMLWYVLRGPLALFYDFFLMTFLSSTPCFLDISSSVQSGNSHGFFLCCWSSLCRKELSERFASITKHNRFDSSLSCSYSSCSCSQGSVERCSLLNSELFCWRSCDPGFFSQGRSTSAGRVIRRRIFNNLTCFLIVEKQQSHTCSLFTLSIYYVQHNTLKKVMDLG